MFSKVGNWMFGENTHFKITIGLFLAVIVGIATAAMWTSDTSNDIEQNATAIETKANGEQVEWMLDILDDHDEKIEDLNDAVTAQTEAFEWIKKSLARLEGIPEDGP